MDKIDKQLLKEIDELKRQICCLRNQSGGGNIISAGTVQLGGGGHGIVSIPTIASDDIVIISPLLPDFTSLGTCTVTITPGSVFELQSSNPMDASLYYYIVCNPV